MTDSTDNHGEAERLERVAAVRAEYDLLCHAMQSGVAYILERDERHIRPKHLRTGVNSALCSEAALARLLVAKGIITELEHVTAQRDEMAAEVKRYETELSEALGTTITLR